MDSNDPTVSNNLINPLNSLIGTKILVVKEGLVNRTKDSINLNGTINPDLPQETTLAPHLELLPSKLLLLVPPLVLLVVCWHLKLAKQSSDPLLLHSNMKEEITTLIDKTIKATNKTCAPCHCLNFKLRTLHQLPLLLSQLSMEMSLPLQMPRLLLCHHNRFCRM